MTTCLLLPWRAQAEDLSWTISQTSGVARLQTADARGAQTWAPAVTGARLQPPFAVETGIDGHAVLSNGMDSVTVNENSRVEISVDATDNLTKALQTLGNLLYQVLPGKSRRFEVHTPYLVSVVKGTTFAVQVTDEYATVSLVEGLVDVFATDHMNKRHEEEIHPGEVAIFGRGKNRIQVLETTSRVPESSLPMEENLKRLNEALKDLEPIAVEVVNLPVNRGRTDTGTLRADVAADMHAVEAESAGAATEQPRLPDMQDDMDRGEPDAGGGVVVVAPPRVNVDDDVRTPTDASKPEIDGVRPDPVTGVKPPANDPPVNDPPVVDPPKTVPPDDDDFSQDPPDDDDGLKGADDLNKMPPDGTVSTSTNR